MATGQQGDRQQHDDRDLPNYVNHNWLFGLCAIVIVACLVAAIVFAAGVKGLDADNSILQSRLAIIFASFAIAVVLGLLFASTMNKASLEGPVHRLSVVLIGPSAFFILFLAFYTWQFPEDTIVGNDPLTLKRYAQLVADQERRNQWINYGDWKRTLGSQLGVFNSIEEPSIQALLTTVYFHGDESHKIVDPHVQTFFVYGKTYQDGESGWKVPLVKIQRISGRKMKGAEFAKVYITAHSTVPGATVTSAVYVMRQNGEAKAVDLLGSTTIDVYDDPVDCLTVAHYEMDIESVEYGDFVMFDTSRYFQYPEGTSRVELALISPWKKRCSLWEARAPISTLHHDVPILFKLNSGGADEHMRSVAEGSAINTWLKCLDELELKERTLNTSGSQKSKGVLAKCLSYLRTLNHDAKFATCLVDPKVTRDVASYELNSIQNPLILTFNWDEPLRQGVVSSPPSE